MTTFADLGLSAEVLEAITALGYKDPTPIQEQAIPVITRGRDIIGQAQTGSGKTAAFGLPAVDYVDPEDPAVQMLVLAPTRELAIQVAQAMRSFAEIRGIKVVAIFGGQPIPEQTAQLRLSPQIVVGTPGRVKDMIRRGWLQLSDARYVVLDEADEMLSLGFIDDIEWILRQTPSGRQTLLFSATMPLPIRKLADRYLFEPTHIKVENPTLTVESIAQTVVDVEPKQKLDVLCAIIQRERPDAAIVFRKRKATVDELVRSLGDRGIDAKPLHGDMTQGRRDSVMLSFRSGRTKVLVATNVAARGLDISHVTHVISFDVPDDPEEYTHRIGRTGRAGGTGIAYTFASKKEHRLVTEIERVTGATISNISADDAIAGNPSSAKRPAAVADEHVVDRPVASSVPSRAPVEAIPAEREAGAELRSGNGKRPPRVPAKVDGDVVRLFVNAGRRHGVTRDELAGAFSELASVEPSRIKLHHAFAHVDVPRERVDAVVAALSGHELGKRPLKLEPALEQPERRTVAQV